MGRHGLILLAALLLAATAVVAADEHVYGVQFRLEIAAGDPMGAASIRVTQSDRQLRRLRWKLPAQTYSRITATGRIERGADDEITWHVPARGGEFRYRVLITHARGKDTYDARVSDRWAIFRADDVFPPAEVALRRGASGRSELLLDLPRGWRAVTPYPPDAAGRMAVSNPERSFDRPLGWIATGELGSRKDLIGPMLVTIVAPKHQGVQRVPMLALLRWTLPVLQAELDEMPAYLPIIVAGDPMWRGGLSAPNSLFTHASRPLISENGTSTLLHEILHVLMPVPAAARHDWIDEGLAEYLGLVLLERSGTISRTRFAHAVETFRRRGAKVRTMQTPHAKGTVTARAVAILHDLDQELQRRSGGRTDLFDLARLLMQQTEPVDVARLRTLASGLVGTPALQSLSAARIPGEEQ